MNTPNNAAALLPCPFCGSNSIDPKGWASANSAGPACDDCGASAGNVSNNLADNIAAWNTRATMNTAVQAVTPIASVAVRFIDNGDGTITDTQLGLIWSKATLSDEEVDHADAEKLCSELTLAGHTDWRLPTVDELSALADRSRYNPAIDKDAFPDTHSDWYWTSTPCARSSDCAWIVLFNYGGVSGSPRGYSGAFVRAVRSVPAGQ